MTDEEITDIIKQEITKQKNPNDETKEIILSFAQALQ